MPRLYQVAIAHSWDPAYRVTFGFRRTRAAAMAYAKELKSVAKPHVARRIQVVKITYPEVEETPVVRRRNKK